MKFSLRQQNQSCSNLQRRSCTGSRPECSSGPSAMTGEVWRWILVAAAAGTLASGPTHIGKEWDTVGIPISLGYPNFVKTTKSEFMGIKLCFPVPVDGHLKPSIFTKRKRAVLRSLCMPSKVLGAVSVLTP